MLPRIWASAGVAANFWPVIKQTQFLVLRGITPERRLSRALFRGCHSPGQPPTTTGGQGTLLELLIFRLAFMGKGQGCRRGAPCERRPLAVAKIKLSWLYVGPRENDWVNFSLPQRSPLSPGRCATG